jgi:argininosuccinate lyase
MRFAPEYVTHVLNENFEDAKSLFLAPLLSIHYAHLVMLVEQGIVSAADAHTLRVALDGLSTPDLEAVRYDGTYEDLFFYIDRLISQAAGADVSARLHTARSRNDIDMTMYRMRQREFILDVLDGTQELRKTLLRLAVAHRDTLYPAHTHTQPAQPSTVAHYLLGFIEELERHGGRLRAAFETTNRNPLGACAITGTGFPIDRERTSELLGFSGPTGNTYGSIATIDYTLEGLSATAATLVGLGRVVQDLLLWSTIEVGYLRLPDGFVQGSSIMPQKRNPVALEHARAIGSKALGQITGVILAVHNTPFGDIVDTEDDLQPLIKSAFHDATRALRIVAAAMHDADFNVDKMRQRAGENWIAITELADTLVREQGLPFGQTHSIAKHLIARIQRDPGVPLAIAFAEVSKDVVGRSLDYSEARLQELLSPEHFVRIRETLGGPAPAVTAVAVDASVAMLDEDQRWLAQQRTRLADTARLLKTEAARL